MICRPHGRASRYRESISERLLGRGVGLLAWIIWGTGCVAPQGPRGDSHVSASMVKSGGSIRSDSALHLDSHVVGRSQRRSIEALAAIADAQPTNYVARLESGLAHMEFTLAGAGDLQARAEYDLEAAFALRPDDPVLARKLGRFYNMRAVANDMTKAEMQTQVFAALLGAQSVESMDVTSFVAYSFHQLGVILALKNGGHPLRALSAVTDLEARLGERARKSPETIELWALAGNFLFFFAGNIPFERRRRVADGVGYFEHVREHWSEIRPGAGSTQDCPNTYENFMFELAEGYLVLGELEQAAQIHRELSVAGDPVTRPKEQIALVSQERLKNAQRYRGDMRLMPPWPSDEANCIVCHSYTAEISISTLHSLETIDFGGPTAAVAKPFLGSDDDGLRRRATVVEKSQSLEVPVAVRALLRRRCAPCHYPGGTVAGRADFSRDAGIVAAGEWIWRHTKRGTMPPRQPLSSDEVGVIEEWAQRLILGP